MSVAPYSVISELVICTPAQLSWQISLPGFVNNYEHPMANHSLEYRYT